MHAAWLDELTPRLYHTHTAMVGVTRETKGETSDGKDGLRLWGDTFKADALRRGHHLRRDVRPCAPRATPGPR